MPRVPEPTAYYYQNPAAWQQQQWGRPAYAQPPSGPAPAAAPLGASAASLASPNVKAQQAQSPYGHFSSAGYDEPVSYGASPIGNAAGQNAYAAGAGAGGIHSFLGGSPAPQQSAVAGATRPGQASPEQSFKGYAGQQADGKTSAAAGAQAGQAGAGAQQGAQRYSQTAYGSAGARSAYPAQQAAGQQQPQQAQQQQQQQQQAYQQQGGDPYASFYAQQQGYRQTWQ